MKVNTSLHQKTLKGILWSFIDQVGNQGIQFIIMIILARILSPEHFGLIGMIMIFMAISQTLIDSGFSQALIREEKVSKIDYSTTFLFNLFISILLFFLIYFLTPYVSNFYDEPELTPILRILSIVIFFHAISIVPRTILIRKIDFRAQTKISIIAVTTSGIVAVAMAFLGLGVWSLVFRIVIQKAIESVMLIYINRWVPSIGFSFRSFKAFFSFGWKLLISGLIDTIYKNSYYVIIGKMYSKNDLGFYTNARQLRDAINQGITMSIQRVTYPVLSSIQSEKERLKYSFKKMVRLTAYVFFPTMIGIAAISNNLVIFLMGQKWEPAVLYFQLLCLAAILFPMHAINLNILKVKGRSDLFLKIEIAKKIMTTIALVITIALNLGVASFIVTAIITTHLGFMINTYYSGKEIGYGTKDQIKDLLPSYIISIIMGIVVYFFGTILSMPIIIIIILQIALGAIVYMGMSIVFKVNEFKNILAVIRPILFKVLKG